MRFLLVLFGLSLFCGSSVAQDQVPVVEQVRVNKFRQSLLKAADAAAKAGEIKRVDVVRLRVATLSPAFLAQAERLAVIQMAFSGEEVPTLDDGRIDVAKIDWEGLILFLEKLIPLILKLIDLFAMNGGEVMFYV
jgi:hypothetical protein